MSRFSLRHHAIRFVQRVLKLQVLHRFTDFVVRTKVDHTAVVAHVDLTLTLCHSSPQLRSRNLTFSVKEPETLEWIDGFGVDDELWDIGANVGLYSVYAAKKGVKVTAIEPSVFNLEFLVRNVTLNHVQDRVKIFPLAVGADSVRPEKLTLSSGAWGDSGHSLNAADVATRPEARKQFEYSLPAVPLDSLLTLFELQPPDYVKIDVDGIEPLIVESGTKVFRTVKSVLVEIPPNDEAAKRITNSLQQSGLHLAGVGRQNQIWRR